jgi:hypothetical protein
MPAIGCRRVAAAGVRGQHGGMLETSRLVAVGVFLIGVVAGASVCGAGRPTTRGADHGGAIPWTAACDPGSLTPSTFPPPYRIGK